MRKRPAVWPKWDREESARLIERVRSRRAALERVIGAELVRALVAELEKRKGAPSARPLGVPPVSIVRSLCQVDRGRHRANWQSAARVCGNVP
jgi:hypothetical protein